MKIKSLTIFLLIIFSKLAKSLIFSPERIIELPKIPEIISSISPFK